MNKSGMREFFASLLFPKRCRFCAKVIDFRLPMCYDCLSMLDVVAADACALCGAPKGGCGCGKTGRYYDRVIAPYYYGGTAGQCARRLKFGHDTGAAVTLGDDMAGCIASAYDKPPFDMVACVPMSAGDYKKRGFNQAQLLAQRVAQVTGIQYAPLLEKTTETAVQHRLSRDERKGNLLGCFTVTGGADLTGVRVLLCDDIFTTGATADECAKTLRIAGAESVTVLCAAVTKPKTKPERERNDANPGTDGGTGRADAVPLNTVRD